MCLVMPIVAYVDYNLLITLRVVQGLICVSYRGIARTLLKYNPSEKTHSTNIAFIKISYIRYIIATSAAKNPFSD